jgi:DNA-binding MarR family transcriptional regulator
MGNSAIDDLAGSLQRFGLARDQMRAALARRAGMAESDLDALEHLEAAGPLTQRQLGQRLALTSGAITMLVDRLERGGWVQRRPHPSDRRYTLLELTAQAERDEPAGLARYHAAIRSLVTSVPPRYRAPLRAFLDEAAQAAAEAASELDPRSAG